MINAISIRAHHAFAMLNFGKRLINKDFKPDALIGTRIVLHAGKKIGDSESKPSSFAGFRDLAVDMIQTGDYLAMPYWPKRTQEPCLMWSQKHIGNEKDPNSVSSITIDDCPKGVLFATAVLGYIDGCKSTDGMRWGRIGHHWWTLDDFKPLKVSIKCSGRQGVWVLPLEMEELIYENM